MEQQRLSEPESPVEIYYEESAQWYECGDHFHNRHEILLVIAGCAEVVVSGEPHIAPMHSLAFIGNLEQHQTRVLQYPYKRYVLTLSTEFCLLMLREPALLSVLLHRPPQFPYVARLGAALTAHMEKLARSLMAECAEKAAFWETRAASLVEEMLIALYRYDSAIFPKAPESAAMRAVLGAQTYIARHFAEKILLEDLAKQAFISKFYLSRMFREITGYPFQEYLIRYRLNKAQELLRGSERSVLEISFAVGYENVNHFIRVFRLRNGVPPLQYRKISRAAQPKG